MAFGGTTVGSAALMTAVARFAVAALRPLVLEIFTISRFNLVFPLFGGVREALAALASDGLGPFDAS